VNNLTPEIKRYIAGGGHALFALSLFLSWFAGVSGWTILPSGWLWFAAAAIVTLIIAAEIFGFDLPPFLNDRLAVVLSAPLAFYMLATLLESVDGGIGYWLGLIGALVGFSSFIIIAHEEA
jgi:hypothetical protein